MKKTEGDRLKKQGENRKDGLYERGSFLDDLPCDHAQPFLRWISLPRFKVLVIREG